VQTEFRLAYSTGDPQGQPVCEKIKSHVESLFKGGTGKSLSIILEGHEPRELHRLVFSEHRYDFAYVPYDFPDDWHPLGLAATLDPGAAQPGGRNFCEFAAPGVNPQVEERDLDADLRALTDYRDSRGRSPLEPTAFTALQTTACRSSRSGNSIATCSSTRDSRSTWTMRSKPSPIQIINPTLLFQNVARWRLE